MAPEEVLESLIRSGVIRPDDDEDSVELSDDFVQRVAQIEEELRGSDDVRRKLESRLSDEDVDYLLSIENVPERFYAELIVLLNRLDERPISQVLNIVTVLDQFERGLPPTDGVPEYFLPVDGDQLPFLISAHRRAIVYVWKHDCPPCDAVRDDFETLLHRPPQEIALFAVFGPDWAELLHEKYDVVGAPTTLFVADGEIETRMQGAYYQESLENEIDILRSR